MPLQLTPLKLLVTPKRLGGAGATHVHAAIGAQAFDGTLLIPLWERICEPVAQTAKIEVPGRYVRCAAYYSPTCIGYLAPIEW